MIPAIVSYRKASRECLRTTVKHYDKWTVLAMKSDTMAGFPAGLCHVLFVPVVRRWIERRILKG